MTLETVLLTLATSIPASTIMCLIFGTLQAARYRRELRMRTWILCYRIVGANSDETSRPRNRYAYCVLPKGHVGECATTAAQLELSGYTRPPF